MKQIFVISLCIGIFYTGGAFCVDLPAVPFPTATPQQNTSDIPLDFVEFPKSDNVTVPMDVVPFPEPKESLLKATQFPKTIQDLSFKSRMELQEDGYEPFADLPSYDIFTILYTDQNISEEIAKDEEENDENEQVSEPITPIEKTGYCQQEAPHIPKNQKIPIGKPVLESDYKYCSGYGMRNMGTKEKPKPDPHHGFDIGCTIESFDRPVFTAADGVVELVKTNRRGSSAGNYIKIDHQNGFKTYYMHLNTILVRPGQTVSAGCQIATIGYTGGAKAFKAALDVEYPQMRKEISHLHYEIHYSGSKTSVTDLNGKQIPIVHKFENNQSIDPSYFMGIK